MKRFLGLLVATFFLASASIALAKDYQVTGPIVDVKDDVVIVKKGNENWEIARDKDTKAGGDVKKGDRVTVKYRMIATSIETKGGTKAKDTKATEKETKAKDTKTEAKAEAKAKEKH